MELHIEKLVYGGDGLARVKSGGPQERAKAVFVPYVLPGESVEAGIVEERPGFARARLDRVLKPSELRTEPPCPYYGSCGGCHYQHTGYDEQLRLKSEVLRETLRRVAKIDLSIDIRVHSSPPLHYRNRSRFHLRSSPKLAIGYFRHGSHELLPVRECPISSALINRALGELWRIGEEGQIPAGINEIEFFVNETDEHLLTEIYTRSVSDSATKEFAQLLAVALPAIQGIVSFEAVSTSGKPERAPRTRALFGESNLNYHVGEHSYRVSAGSFFQTNFQMVPKMVQVVAGRRRGRAALDLYSGVGLFAVALARTFERVFAVESAPPSAEDLRANMPENVKVSSQSVEAYLTSIARTVIFDLVVVDPPRSGLGVEVCAQLEKLSPNEIVYVSCNPATLARDLKHFLASGWRISEMHLLDLFPQTFHIESCAVLQR